MVSRYVVGVLLLLTASSAWAEHLGDEFAWMKGSRGRQNQSCCGVMDCTEGTVALLSQDGIETTVMIGETVVTLPTWWVYPSKGHTGVWCFVPEQTKDGKVAIYIDANGNERVVPPKIPSKENTRCAFYLSLG